MYTTSKQDLVSVTFKPIDQKLSALHIKLRNLVN